MAYKTRPGESQFQARQRIARAKGFDGYRQYRKASPQVRERSTRGLAERDPAFRRNLQSATSSIKRRSNSKVTTAAGTVLTSTSMVRQYAHVRAGVRAHGADAVVSMFSVLRLGSVDRRRRDPRRGRGRDTGYRTVRGVTTADELDTDEGFEAFSDAFDSWIDELLEGMYGGAGESWSLDSLAVTV